MRELKGNWKDFFYLFEVALDLKKLLLALIGSFLAFGILIVAFFCIGRAQFNKNRAYFDRPQAVASYYQFPTSPNLLAQGVGHGFEVALDLPCHHGFHPPKGESKALALEAGQTQIPYPRENSRALSSLLVLAGILLFINFIWAYFGGAICRMAAVNLIKDESVGLRTALGYASKRYKQYFYPMVLVFILLLLFGGTNALVGFLAGVPIVHLVAAVVLLFIFGLLLNKLVLKGMGEGKGSAKAVAGFFLVAIFVVAGYFLMDFLSSFEVLRHAFRLDFLLFLAFPLALISGFIMAMILIGAVLGFPLFYPVIAVEGTDFFDATSRSMSYVLARPLHYFFYEAVGDLYGVVTTAVVVFVGWLMIKATLFTGGLFYSTGLGYDRLARMKDVLFGQVGMTLNQFFHAAPWHESVALIVLGVWLYLVLGLIAAYVLSYFFCSQTLIYILMRKTYDAIEVDEIYEEPGDKAEVEEPEVEVLDGAKKPEGESPSTETASSTPSGGPETSDQP